MLSAIRRSVDRAKPLGGAGKGDKPWRPEFHKLLICDNGKDNTPESFVRGEMPNETVFFISQSRSPGHKDQGQDCMATSHHGDWECNVLCDGHDRDGHLVARAVCHTLPQIVLRRIHSRTNTGAKVEASLLRQAFEECSNTINWTSEGVRTGMFIKVFGGAWDGKVGYVGDSRDTNTSVVIIVDAEGYHRPTIDNKFLKRAKYTGGSTCVLMVRNVKTADARIAFTGDSRAMMVCAPMFEDPIIRPTFGLQTYDRKGKATVPPMGLTTPAHNVFSKEELLRLNSNHAGAFEIDGAFLVNPVTKFAIQPTRGFGDFDMFGTGYTNEPEISSSFKLKEGTFVFCASDGVFDEHVWKDDELVTFFAQQLESGPDAARSQRIAELLYRETLERSIAGGYVDDISFFMFLAPEPTLDETDASSESASSEAMDPARISAGSRRGSRKGRKKSMDEGAVDEDETTARARKEAKSLPSSGGRKSLLGALWNKKRSGRASRAKSDRVPPEDIDEDLVKPDIDKPTPEDRRKTIDRKERGSFTELSNMLKEAITSRENGVKVQAAEEKEDSEELAKVVLQRYASRYGHDIEDVDLGRHVRGEAAREGARLSARFSRRKPLFDDDDEEDDEDA